MATQYPNSGKLSNNKYKEQGDKKPDMHGEIVMTRTVLKQLLEETDEDDITIKLSAWAMEGSYGPWMRLAWNNYKPKNEDAPQPRQTPAAQANKGFDDMDDDIPF
jgi:single-stranded DNA-binding protein